MWVRLDWTDRPPAPAFSLDTMLVPYRPGNVDLVCLFPGYFHGLLVKGNSKETTPFWGTHPDCNLFVVVSKGLLEESLLGLAPADWHLCEVRRNARSECTYRSKVRCSGDPGTPNFCTEYDF